MTLNGKEYSKEFLEQLLMDTIQIADYIHGDVASFDKDRCDIEGYEEFSNKYINL